MTEVSCLGSSVLLESHSCLSVRKSCIKDQLTLQLLNDDIVDKQTEHFIINFDTFNINQEKEATGDLARGSHRECISSSDKSPHSSYSAVRQRNVKISSISSQILHQKKTKQIISELTKQPGNRFTSFYTFGRNKG